MPLAILLIVVVAAFCDGGVACCQAAAPSVHKALFAIADEILISARPIKFELVVFRVCRAAVLNVLKWGI